MRRLRFIPVLLAVLFVSCSKSVMVNPSLAGEEGTLEFVLDTQETQHETKAATAAAGVPNLDDFRVAIYKTENQMRIYNDSYANTVGKKIKMNAGEYRLVAQWGDSLGCGFDKPYYLADPTFTIKQGENSLIATAKMSNVKLAVKYDQSFTSTINEYYAIVKHNTLVETEVKFIQTENRHGYMPAGDIYIEVYAKVGGKLKYFKSTPHAYQPNDFVTFNITTKDLQGNLVIEITTDTTVEDKPITETIPPTALPQPAPTITMAGFTASGNAHTYVEGMNPAEHNGMASFIAKAGIANCILDIHSDYLTKTKGLKAQYDFAHLTSEDSLKLKSVGFDWDAKLKNSRNLSFLNFAGVLQDIVTNVKAEKIDHTIADFTLRVVDAVKKDKVENFKITSLGVTLAINLPEVNVWAKRIESPKVTFTNAIPSLVSFETSIDGVRWTKCENVGVVAGNSIDFGTIKGLTANTTYFIKAVYNNSKVVTSNIVKITTEAAAQVGNNGFEEWNTQKHTYIYPIERPFTYDWYQPWGSSEADPWWAVNSRVAMASNGVAGVSNLHTKSCHTAAPSIDTHSGQKSAHIYTVNVGWSNTDAVDSGKSHIGELFIGKAADNGSHSADGHAFVSRPDKIKFWYKYKASAGTTEKFYAVVELVAADGTSLFRKEINDGPEASVWTAYEIPVTYSDRNKKVAKVIMGFKSCAAKQGDTDANSQLEINGVKDFTAHFGSSLRIDDVEMIYE